MCLKSFFACLETFRGIFSSIKVLQYFLELPGQLHAYLWIQWLSFSWEAQVCWPNQGWRYCKTIRVLQTMPCIDRSLPWVLWYRFGSLSSFERSTPLPIWVPADKTRSLEWLMQTSWIQEVCFAEITDKILAIAERWSKCLYDSLQGHKQAAILGEALKDSTQRCLAVAFWTLHRSAPWNVIGLVWCGQVWDVYSSQRIWPLLGGPPTSGIGEFSAVASCAIPSLSVT